MRLPRARLTERKLLVVVWVLALVIIALRVYPFVKVYARV